MESDLTRDDAELTEARTLVKGAEQARVEAEVRLRQSDVVRRRDELERAVRTANREADGIRERWQALRHALQQEARAVQPLLAERHELAEVDGQALHALVTHTLALSSDDPPPAELASLVKATILVLDKGLRAAQEELFTLERQTKELRQQGQELERELAHLRENGRTYLRDVERVRDLLAPVVGAQPPLLCELLEIPDERWQDAVEAMLGQRRFTIIVAPERFDACLDILDTARSSERLYDVGLLDLSKASHESRPAQPHSLAQQITAAPLVQAYVDTVLGDIITCDSVAELRRYRRAVTPEVMVYGEWTARALPPSRYQPWFVGARARHRPARRPLPHGARAPRRDRTAALQGGYRTGSTRGRRGVTRACLAPATREHPHGAARVGAYQRCAEQARIPQRTLPFPLPPHGGCP